MIPQWTIPPKTRPIYFTDCPEVPRGHLNNVISQIIIFYFTVGSREQIYFVIDIFASPKR